MKLKVECTLFLSDPSVVSSVHPTPVATCGRVPCGVAQLQGLVQFCDPIDAAVANLQVNPLEKHRKTHLISLVPTWGTLF